MLGIVNIMHERRKQEEKIKNMKHKQQITISVSKEKTNKESLLNKIIEEHRNSTNECIITDCNFTIKTDDVDYYKCIKYYND